MGNPIDNSDQKWIPIGNFYRRPARIFGYSKPNVVFFYFELSVLKKADFGSVIFLRKRSLVYQIFETDCWLFRETTFRPSNKKKELWFEKNILQFLCCRICCICLLKCNLGIIIQEEAIGVDCAFFSAFDHTPRFVLRRSHGFQLSESIL